MNINDKSKAIIEECVKESHDGTISFATIVTKLIAASKD